MNPPELADPSPPRRATPIVCAPTDRAGRFATRVLRGAATAALLLLAVVAAACLLRQT